MSVYRPTRMCINCVQKPRVIVAALIALSLLLGSGGTQAQRLAGAGNVVDGGKFGHRAARSERKPRGAHARARETP